MLTEIFSRSDSYYNLDADGIALFMTNQITACAESCTTRTWYTRKRFMNEKMWKVDAQIVRMSNAKKKLLVRKRRQPRNLRLNDKIAELGRKIDARRNLLASQYCSSKFSNENPAREKWSALNKILGRHDTQTRVIKIQNRTGT